MGLQKKKKKIKKIYQNSVSSCSPNLLFIKKASVSPKNFDEPDKRQRLRQRPSESQALSKVLFSHQIDCERIALKFVVSLMLVCVPKSKKVSECLVTDFMGPLILQYFIAHTWSIPNKTERTSTFNINVVKYRKTK